MQVQQEATYPRSFGGFYFRSLKEHQDHQAQTALHEKRRAARVAPSIKVEVHGTAHEEDEGQGRITTIASVYAHPSMLRCEIEAILRETYPSERCHHEYDCCGHYYSHGANLMSRRPGEFPAYGKRWAAWNMQVVSVQNV